jgi:AraC-like DNA-binding protein
MAEGGIMPEAARTGCRGGERDGCAGERPGSVAGGEAGRHRLARRVAALLRTPLDEPVTVRGLGQAFGVAPRIFSLGFRACFGWSPMAYPKGLRLEAAHDDRRRSRAATTLTDAATRWRCFPFGAFAAAYRALFGELPSPTRRGAGGAPDRRRGRRPMRRRPSPGLERGRISDRAVRLAAGMGLALAACAAPAAAQTRAGDLGIERPQAFALADTNGDNCLQLQELARDMAWRFAALDTNRDRVLEASELIDPPPGRFVALDANHDGRLTFMEVMTAKTSDFRAADRNGRGCLAIDDVVAVDREPQGGAR